MRLNRDFLLSAAVLAFVLAFSGMGVHLLTATSSRALGSNLLMGGLGLLLYMLKGNTDFLSWQ
jgi:hypothetical protein